MTRHDSTPSPAYRRQKRKNGKHLAFVVVGDRRHYLGLHNSPESLEAYQRIVAELRANSGSLAASPRVLTVMELCNLFLKHADAYYRNADGERGQEYENHLSPIRILSGLYGRKRIADFTPKDLKAARQKMIDHGWARRHINRQIVRLRSIFKWGVSEDLVPVEVYNALTTFPGLHAGRTEATESEPVHPVTKEQVEAIFPHVPRVVRDMIRLQWFTGMRPGEVVIVRPIDIDTTGDVWLYRPFRHKTQLHGRQRVIPLGPKAQKVLRPYLANRPVHAFCFSPREANAQRRAKRRAERTTPLSCGNQTGTNRKDALARQPGERYRTATYARAVAYGCRAARPHPTLSKVKANMLTDEDREELLRWHAEHRWSPNQLRHAAATRVRSIAGLEMARAVLGHSTMAVTETYYAEADIEKTAKLMAKMG